eukprot:305271_1
MAHRQQQKKRKKKKKCKQNKVRNNRNTIKTVKVRKKKSEKQPTMIHSHTRPEREEIKENRNYGLIDWRVTGDLLHQFKNAKHEQIVYSPQFKIIDGTSWRIKISTPRMTLLDYQQTTNWCKLVIQHYGSGLD